MSALGIIIAIFVIILIIYILRYSFYSTNTLTSVQNGKTASSITASQLPTTSTGAAASNFAYSIWFYVDNWNYKYGSPKIILGRMGGKSDSSSGSGIQGIFGAQPCPIIALGAIENTLTCALSCFGGLQDSGSTSSDASKTTVHTCMIGNIPLQRWVNIVVSVNNQTMEMYMDGKMVRTCVLPGTANVDNSSSLEITPNGGFEGYTANIQYWPGPKNSQEVMNIYQSGYKNNLFGNLFNTYSLQVNVTENGVTQGSITI